MARVVWSGAISFGLVTVPVKLVSAIQDHRIRLHMLSEDGTCRLRRKLFCPESGKEYDFEEASRGYEIAPDQYVLLHDDELESLKVDAGHQIRILNFVGLDEIDPIYFDRSYYVVPDELGATSYRLLLEAMSKKHRIGLAKCVMRHREYLPPSDRFKMPLRSRPCVMPTRSCNRAGSSTYPPTWTSTGPRCGWRSS